MRFFVLFVLATVPLISLSQSREVKQADELFAHRKYHQALAKYEEALSQKPDNAEVLNKAANAAIKAFDSEKALTYSAQALEQTKQTNYNFIFTRAEALQLAHRFDEAILQFKKSDPQKTNHRVVSKRVRECQSGQNFVKAPVKFKITNLGSRVNSNRDDLLPKTTADLSKLYFTSHRPGAFGGDLNPEDIYVCENSGGTWSDPVQMKGPINTADNDACVGLSPDGQTMFLFKGINGGDLFESEQDGEKWSTPKALSINTTSKETSVTISPDGRQLFFDRKAAGGIFNIYTCKKNAAGRWSKPILLKGVNSRYDDRAPFMHPDGKTLFFSSNGHNTIGGYDIFVTRKNDDGTWTKPENLGFPLNTAADELCFTLSADARIGFYNSAKKGGYGGQDIYSIRMPPSKKPNLALVKGKVIEENTNKPVEAEITVTDNDANQVVGTFKSNSSTGEYLISLPAGKNYGISIEKEGHLFHSENVYLEEGATYKALKKNIKLVDATPGARIILNNIFFESGKYILSPSSHAELNRLAKLLKTNSSLRIEISGHTDNVGNPEANQKLSENRAKTVVEYLMTKGIPSSRLEYKGYGSTKPVASNDSAKGRQKNRRTEFKIL